LSCFPIVTQVAVAVAVTVSSAAFTVPTTLIPSIVLSKLIIEAEELLIVPGESSCVILLHVELGMNHNCFLAIRIN